MTVSGVIPVRAFPGGRLTRVVSMPSREIYSDRYDDGKVIVVDQVDDGVVEVFDIGHSDGEIASYGYENSALTQESARALAKEYALGWLDASTR
jgi:hypothetical protein